MKTTLEALLVSKDLRAKKQILMVQYFKRPLAVMKLNIPGEIKTCEKYRKAFCLIQSQFIEFMVNRGFQKIYSELNLIGTGDELYLVFDKDAIELKKACLAFEKWHQLGRFLDIDVIQMDGKPISRQDMGYPPRTCFICEEMALVCMRKRAHSEAQLLELINESFTTFLNTST